MANRHTGIGHYVFVQHRLVTMMGDTNPFREYRICMHCCRSSSELGYENETHCADRAQFEHREAVRQRRAENGL